MPLIHKNYRSGEDIYPKEMLSQAYYYRELALAIDQNPDDIKNHFHHQFIHHHIFDKDSLKSLFSPNIRTVKLFYNFPWFTYIFCIVEKQ